LRAKLKPRALQFHVGFPESTVLNGTVHPYFRATTNTTFGNLVPDFGYVWTNSFFKVHGRVTRRGEEVTYQESAAYQRDNVTVAAKVGVSFSKLLLHHYSMVAAWATGNAELSFETGNGMGGYTPSYLECNAFLKRGNTDYGVKVAGEVEDISKAVVSGYCKQAISKTFWYKLSMDSKGRTNNYTYFNWGGAQIGLTTGTSVASGKDYAGYLDYPFNWGLSFKFNA